ncbi:MAG: sulfotransferase [Promethearchaeota archaeon]
MEDPIFIVGLPRSGSTLWLNILAQNPKIFRIGEMLFLTPWRRDFRYFLRKQVGDLSLEKNIDKMIELIFSHKLFPGITASFWTAYIEKVNDPHLKNIIYRRFLKSDKSLENIFKIIIEEITAFKGYGRCCVKFPVYVNHVPDIIKWYPKCKIVHITRDPRAMVISRKNDPLGTGLKLKKYPHLGFIIRNILTLFVVIQYIWTSKLHYKYKGIKNYALFKYEDLLADPNRVVKELCDFVGIDFVPDMLEPKEGQASSVTGKKQKGFNKYAASHWKKVISPFEERIITFFTKSSMKRFEFDPKNHPVYYNV